ncbi:hypothetical protein [Candidatus Nitrosocosmicus sp. R]
MKYLSFWIFALIISVGPMTSFALNPVIIQSIEASSNERCTSFDIVDEDITSERCTVQGQDPTITDTTCTDGECSSQSSETTNKEAAQAQQGSKQLCKEYTKENEDNPDPWFTCTTK